jgi:hypothetical protein
MSIQMVSETEFNLTSGNNRMNLSLKENGEWRMITDNPSARAWRRIPSARYFDSLEAVELHYRSWRGIATLLGAKTNG